MFLLLNGQTPMYIFTLFAIWDSGLMQQKCNEADAHTQWTEMTRNLMTRSDPKGKKREGALAGFQFVSRQSLRRPRCDGIYVAECGFQRWVRVGHHTVPGKQQQKSPSAIFSCSNDKSYSATERFKKKRKVAKASRSHKSWAQMLSA